MLTWKEKLVNFFVQNRKKILIVVVVIIVVIVLALFYFYFKDELKLSRDNSGENQTTCGKLVTTEGQTEGLAPFKPMVKAKIDGNYDSQSRVCLWEVNGQNFGTSQPEDGYCVRAGLVFYNVGDYKVKLTVDGSKKCSEEMTLKVTDLTEEQKKVELEIKRSGQTPEDIELTR